MKKSIFLLFPIHLFRDINNLENKKVYLIEEPRYFLDFKYHKLKLVYHRASMKSYFDYLTENNIDVEYISYRDVNQSFYKRISKGVTEIKCYDMNDFPLETKLKKTIKTLEIIPSLNFTLNPQIINDNKHEFAGTNNKYRHDLFYQWQRRRLNILMNPNGKPKGGRWSFDKDNRKPLPKGISLPFNPPSINNEYYEEAKNYITENLQDNYGEIEETIYPIDHRSAKKWLVDFLEDRFRLFGKYEDAETERNPFLFHSVLTPMMNIGLLTDTEVLTETAKFEDKVPIESYEGFVRQIIGWRNYIYTMYVLEGPKMKKGNFMKYRGKLDERKWWNENGEQIGVPPIDFIIQKIRKYSYAHHIERLMYLGNFMYLLEIDPKIVYKMFMEWTIDAYEWVMVPNVFGMSQYADGGMMMTRPYFSSSNYILKMSEWKRGEWCEKWDILYYNFIGKNVKMLKKNYATAQQVVHWERKSEKEKKKIKSDAKRIIGELRGI